MDNVTRAPGTEHRGPAENRSAQARTPTISVAVVTHRPGPWFEETLHALGAQDYPAVQYLFLDTAGDPGLPQRVRAVLPSAEVRTMRASTFSEAVNEFVASGNLTPFVMLCHDDVALSPTALRRLFEEAIRSNAGVVGPKVVDWENPEILLEVGISVDKTGAVKHVAQPGEVDQAQHDAIRDVFALSSAALLVRGDLLQALRGFDTAMSGQGDDVDFCWRAHIAGARVVLAPSAVARHRETITRSTGEAKGNVRRRNQVRMVLSNYGIAHSIRVVPQAVLSAVVAFVHALFSGQLTRARNITSAWLYSFAHLPSIAAKRGRTRRIRRLSDTEVRRFHQPGFLALTRLTERRAARFEADERSRARDLLAFSATSLGQLQLLVWVATLALLLFGSRELIFDGVPVINEFARFPEDTSALLAESFGNLRGTGLGAHGTPAVAQVLISILGFFFLGQMGLLQTTMILGTFAIAAVGAMRLFAPFDSFAARMLTPLLFVVTPVPFNALVVGSWGALAVFAGLPWLIRWLATLAGVAPYALEPGAPGRLRAIAGAAITLALMAAVAPFVIVLVPMVLIGWILGGWVLGQGDGSLRLVVAAFVSACIAALLHFPQVGSALSGNLWEMIAGSASGYPGSDVGGLATDVSTGLTVSQILTLQSGPHGGGIFGWGLLVLAALGLVLAQGDRLVWAIRGWIIALLCITVAWVGERNLFTASLPQIEVLLAPAAFGLATAAVMAIIAIERDLHSHRFGFRQALPGLAALALVGTMASLFAGSLHGRWEMPRAGYETALRFFDGDDPYQARVLWIGDDQVLPVGGWSYSDSTMAITQARVPTLRELWPVQDAAGNAEIEATMDLALNGGTNRLGRLLAPYGVRWVVIIEDRAPAPFGSTQFSIPARTEIGLSEQLDLIRIDVRDGLTVYRNAAFVPVVATLDIGAGSDVPTPRDPALAANRLDVVGGTNFTGLGNGEFTGTVATGTEVHAAFPLSENWDLEAAGSGTLRSPSFGWGNSFPIASDGVAELNYTTPLLHRAVVGVQLALWALLLVWLTFGSRRRT